MYYGRIEFLGLFGPNMQCIVLILKPPSKIAFGSKTFPLICLVYCVDRYLDPQKHNRHRKRSWKY